MFSEYVVRAVVAEHVEQLRREAVADRLARSTGAAARNQSHRVLSGRLVGRPARALTAALPVATAGPGRSVLPGGSARPQPCGC